MNCNFVINLIWGSILAKRDIACSLKDIVDVVKHHGKVGEGSILIDVGCGTGLFLSEFSSLVGPSGVVVANEIADIFIEYIAQRVEMDQLDNIVIVQGTPHDPIISRSETNLREQDD